MDRRFAAGDRASRDPGAASGEPVGLRERCAKRDHTVWIALQNRRCTGPVQLGELGGQPGQADRRECPVKIALGLHRCPGDRRVVDLAGGQPAGAGERLGGVGLKAVPQLLSVEGQQRRCARGSNSWQLGQKVGGGGR